MEHTDSKNSQIVKKGASTIAQVCDMIMNAVCCDDILVEGEVTAFKQTMSGHWFFHIQDLVENVSVPCIAWKNVNIGFGPVLRSGEIIRVTARLVMYRRLTCLKLEIRELVRSPGVGRWTRKKQILDARLEDAGAYQEPLPITNVNRVTLVTSAQSAAANDFIRTIGDRVKIALIDTRVQGSAAAPSIAAAIGHADDLGFDALVVCRGGGSPFDLACFDSQEVVLAIARCRTPVITGIGHSTDTTLADKAASHVACTPTAAAEYVLSLSQNTKDRSSTY